jgi:hypothetical protein
MKTKREMKVRQGEASKTRDLEDLRMQVVPRNSLQLEYRC